MREANEKIVMKTSDEGIKQFDLGNRKVAFYTQSHGKNQLNEVCDVEYIFENHSIPYHYHDCGAATYMILKGRIELILNGKKCVCEEGDIINVTSYCPYGIRILEKGTLIREMYTGLNVFEIYNEYKLMQQGGLTYTYDDAVKEEFAEKHHFFKLTAPVNPEKIDKNRLPQITAKDKAIYEYDGWDGILCKLKVGRWNLKRVKEVWEYSIDKNYQLQYLEPNENERVYSVKSGEIMVEVNNQLFFAEAEDVIYIPAYTPFTIMAVDEETVVYDWNVSTRLFRMLEMLQLAQRDEVENTLDNKWMKELLDLNNSWLTGFVQQIG